MVTQADLERLAPLSQAAANAGYKRQQMNQEAAMKAAESEQKRATLEGLLRANPKSAVSVGDLSVNPEGENNLMALLNLQERQDARNDRDLVTLGNRVEKEGIPNTMSALANLEGGTAAPDKGGIITNPKYEVKSAGPYANTIRSLPGGQLALNLGEKAGLMPEGAEKESTLIQRLINADIRNLSGTAVTAYEQGRQNVEKGMTAGGNPEMIKLGIKQMQDAIDSSAANIEASTRPEVLQTYRKQTGKVRLSEFLGKQPQGPAKTPVRKQYSASRNQTRITYSDGSQEILDGKQ